MIAGATGTYFFTREDVDQTPPVTHEYLHVGSAQPRSAYMWSEARRLAFELAEIGPSIISNRTQPAATSDSPQVEVSAWQEASGAIMIIAVNLGAEPLPAATLTVTLGERPCCADGVVAAALFGTAPRNLSASVRAIDKRGATSAVAVSIADVYDALSTRLYRLPPPASRPQPPAVADPTTDSHADNLIFNSGFEAASSGPGSADGIWAAWGGDKSATQVTDSAHSHGGTHSMRLTTPTQGKGLRLWTLPVKAELLVNRTYSLSLWTKSVTKGATLSVGFEALFGKANVSCPAAKGEAPSYGQCSYTPQPVVMSTSWEQKTWEVPARFQPDKTGYNGAAGMISIELIEPGVAWVDDLKLKLKTDEAVSRLHRVRAAQNFSLAVTDGGALEITVGGTVRAVIASSFSQPGPRYNNFSSAAAAAAGWNVSVDSSAAKKGRWRVSAATADAAYAVDRAVQLDPFPLFRRVLINDTIVAGDATVGMLLSHVASFPGKQIMQSAIAPGTYFRDQCGTDSNYHDLCSAPCLDKFVQHNNQGRADIFANSTLGHGNDFALGMTAVDDVFRVHAQVVQRATKGLSRTLMTCAVTAVPSIELKDPFFALGARQSYTLETAVYVLTDAARYFDLVNTMRHDLGTHIIPMKSGGILSPPDPYNQDTSTFNVTCMLPNGTMTNGSTCYSSCVDPFARDTHAEKLARAKTCWPSWTARAFADFVSAQAGPGGFTTAAIGDFVGDGLCGMQQCSGACLTTKLRPVAATRYIKELAAKTKATGNGHAALLYQHSFISPGWSDEWQGIYCHGLFCSGPGLSGNAANCSEANLKQVASCYHNQSSNHSGYLDRYSDSRITDMNGNQVHYRNCSAKRGFYAHDLPLFYADGRNTYTAVLDDYLDVAFDELGVGGIFHDEFPVSAYTFTYDQHDQRSAFLHEGNLSIRALVGSIVLLTDANELKLKATVQAKGGRLVMNGAPQTRSWIRAMVNDPQHASLNENENSQAWFATHTQLYTPLHLIRYGGNLRDLDLKYNHSDLWPNDHGRRLLAMTAPCLSITDHLDFGALTISYDSLFPNSSTPNIYSRMFPTTALEIGPGFVLGNERVVTKVSGRYTAPGAATASTVFIYDDCMQSSVTAAGLVVNLALSERQIAVIVWAFLTK